MPSPRKKKAEQSSATAKLIEALKFVAPAFKENGQDYQQHCRFANGYLIAFDGVIALGHPVDEDLQLCPHLGRTLAAIKRAGSTLNITELGTGRLSIKGDNLRAIVPCMDGRDIPPAAPDFACADIDERLLRGFAAVNPLIKEGDQNIRWVETAALLRGNTIVATNGHVLLEYWHGIDLPPGLAIPKVAIAAIAKVKKKLVRFGFSPRTVTFHFDDGAWIRAQLYAEEYPPVDDRVIAPSFGQRGPQDVPEAPAGLFDACAAVTPFVEAGALHLSPGVVRSHAQEGVGAEYPVSGLLGNHIVSAEYMKLIAPIAARIDLQDGSDRLIFWGENIRGVVMKMR